MAKTSSSSSDQWVSKLIVGAALVILGWFVIKVVVGWLVGLVTAAVMLLLLGIVLWFVFIGPPGGDE